MRPACPHCSEALRPWKIHSRHVSATGFECQGCDYEEGEKIEPIQRD